MPNSHGRFVWHELMTTNMDAAKTFYGSVVGWGSQDSQMPGMPYWMFTAGSIPVCGLMILPEEAHKMGAPPIWMGYVAVDDVDTATEKVKKLGGAVHRPPHDIPNVGRFSIVADPQEASFALFKFANPERDEHPAPGTPGYVGWNELYAIDWEKAFAFYSDMFGWRKADAMNMGEMGIYQLFAHGEQTIGGMFNKPPQMPVPCWNYYFNVGDINASVGRVNAAGGKIINGPMQVPGGDWIVQGIDPQGAMFSLVGKRK